MSQIIVLLKALRKATVIVNKSKVTFMMMLYLVIVASTKLLIKLCIKEGIQEKPLFLRSMYGVAFTRALNLLLAFLEGPLP